MHDPTDMAVGLSLLASRPGSFMESLKTRLFGKVALPVAAPDSPGELKHSLS
jgi:hypothetical protein